MPTYQTDLRDIYFNLCEHHNISQYHDDYEEQDIKVIIEEFDKFVGEVIWPTREQTDLEGVKMVDGKVRVPECLRDVNTKFFENGWYGLGYPEEIGGIPAPYAVNIACASLLNSSNLSYSLFIELTRGAMNLIMEFASAEMKEKCVSKMMSGEWSGTMCLTEAGAGSDVGALRTTAVKQDDGRYKISGNKVFISCGDHDINPNIAHLVLARTPDAPQGTKGISLFLVTKNNDDGSSNDVKCTKVEEKMGLHGSPTCELVFGEEGNCFGEIIGEECAGMAEMFVMMNEVRLFCGIQGESQANMAYMLSEKYAKERTQFKTEIANLADVKRMLLKMRSKARGLRALNYYVASLFDRKNKGEDTETEIALLTPISKAYCTDESVQICNDAIQVHGGYGYIKEYGVEQFLRDAKIGAIYEGTNGIQAMDFVARKVLKDQGKALQEVFKKILKTIAESNNPEFSKELKLLKLSLDKTKDILFYYEEMHKEGNMDAILGSAVDFLNYVSRMVVSWLLLEQAIIAKSKLEEASGDERDYFESKIVDYKFFTHHELALNAGLYQTICVFKEDYKNIKI